MACKTASESGNHSCRKKHEMLADFIKNVHSSLRENVRKANGDFQSVWKEHCEDEVLLQQYAGAMRELAVQYWRGNNLRRTEWCKQICTEYFHQGGYEKCMRKDCRRVLLNLDQHQECPCKDEAAELERQLSRDPVTRDKLLLLDVGSCFNPFQTYPEIFIPLAIDLCPADESVLKCDFLQLNIRNQQDHLNKTSFVTVAMDNPSASTSELKCRFPHHIQTCINEGTLEQLSENCFDIVVFCLLLSYLPTRTQRWDCCKKAHELLKDRGLLIIITPDSSHQNKNVEMIKSWKTAIESLGFFRLKYQKDDHTHRMAFRKKTLCRSLRHLKKSDVEFAEMMYIHQELQDTDGGGKPEETWSVTDYERKTILCEGFDALPFSSV